MPCNDGGPIWSEQEVINLKAMLCGIAQVLEDQHALTNVLSAVDWNNAGVSRHKFVAWWENHKAEDAERKQHEARRLAEQTRVANLRATAEAKLTPEELAAIRGR